MKGKETLGEKTRKWLSIIRSYRIPIKFSVPSIKWTSFSFYQKLRLDKVLEKLPSFLRSISLWIGNKTGRLLVTSSSTFLQLRKQISKIASTTIPFISHLGRTLGSQVWVALVILLKVSKQLLKWLIIVELFVFYFAIYVIMWVSTSMQFDSMRSSSPFDLFIPFNVKDHDLEEYAKRTRRGMMAGYNKFFIVIFQWLLRW